MGTSFTVKVTAMATADERGRPSDEFDHHRRRPPCNDAPTVANPLPDQTATVGTAFSYVFPANTFSDADTSDTLTYTATKAAGTDLPLWLAFAASTRTFSGTPTDAGMVALKVTASDGNGGSVSDEFDIVVAAAGNNAPTVANPLADQTATVGTAFSYVFPANTFSDADTSDTLTYTATKAAGTDLPLWLAFAASTRTFSGTPTDAGMVALKVTASDGNGGSVSDEFDIVVAAAGNNAPTVANPLADQTATVGTAFSYVFPANTFSDADTSDTLTYTATKAAGTDLPLWLAFAASTRTFSGTPTDAGMVALKVTASDGNGGSVSDEFDIVVAAAGNNAPTVANTIPDQTATVGTAFSYVFPANTFSDADTSDTLTYTATKAAGTDLPLWLAFAASTRTFSGTPTDAGMVALKVTASDGNGGSVSDEFDIVVAAAGNNAPTVANTIPDQTATVGTAFSYVFPANTFSDADTSDTLTYTATKAAGTDLPLWLAFAASTRTFSGTPTDVGTVSVKVTASDGNGGSVSDTFDITVSAAGDTTPPTLTSATVWGGEHIELQFSENTPLLNQPPGSAFTVTADGVAVTTPFSPTWALPSTPDLLWLQVSPVIFQGQAVVVTYTDPTAGDDANAIQDTAGNDAATFTTGMNGVPAVTNNSLITNTPATGAPTITGRAQVGQTLPAGTRAIMDADGLTSVSYTYQWIRVGRRHRDEHLRGNGEHLHAGGGRPGHDDQGEGELHRRRQQRRDADQRGDEGRLAGVEHPPRRARRRSPARRRSGRR